MTRRELLTTAAAATLVAARPTQAAPPASLRLGLCSYSFGKMKLADALPELKQARVRYLNIKPEFHLPYDSTPAAIAEMKRWLADNGLVLAGTGATYLQKPDLAEIRQRFEFNKALGSPLIVLGPTRETLPLIEKFVQEYDIKVAIHNHGPSDKHFPTPQSALDFIKGMDPRVGLCMDIGHTVRSGVDPTVAAREAGPRLLDLHTKDIKGNVAADCGEGTIDLPGLLRQLKAQNFQGAANLEYEDFGPKRAVGIQKCLAYLNGVAAAI